MKVYIVRHGQTDSNLAGVYNLLEEDLNENGINQAKALSEKIKDLDYEVIYCSPLKRTIHTANIINRHNKEIIFDERLVERKHGKLAGMPWTTVDREKHWNYYNKEKYADEESVPELFERVNGFIEELKYKDYKSILIVAHSGVSKAFYGYFNGIPDDGEFLKLGLKNGEFAEYEFEQIDIYNENKEKTGKIKIRHKDTLKDGEFIIGIQVAIINSDKKILITQRSNKKEKSPLLWECNGGALQHGESELEGIVREIKEELGIVLDKKDGILIKTIKKEHKFKDIFLFKKDINIKDLKFFDGEVIDAKWVTIEEFNKMKDDGLIVHNIDFDENDYNRCIEVLKLK